MGNIIKIFGKRCLQLNLLLAFIIVFQVTVYATTEENIVENTVDEPENIVETQNPESMQEEKVEEPVKEESQPPTEIAKNEIMYVQERCNIRASYSVDSDRVGGLDVGTEVTVIAEYSNGWYKIKYKDKEAYIKAGILRSTKPEIEEPLEENAPEPEENQANQQEEVKIENENQENLPETEVPAEEVDIEDAEMINEIGVLPEVGRNIADYLYIGVIIFAIGLIIYIKTDGNWKGNK